ncbi:MAG: carbamoyl-phosphate synthase large subunit, partial [Clostridiales bacterium]|nr:carbamoyl-phosphate synthase large subunit [Clostridiales bacterium]
MTEPPIYAELGHAMPSGLTNELKKRITEITKLAIKALGINHGAVNMDLLITEKEQIFLVDIGARMGGNLIGSHIIPIGTGIDYMKILIKAAMGQKFNVEAEHPAKHVATRLLALNPGKVTGLPDFDAIKKKHQVEIFHHLKVGDIIREYQNNLDGFGYVVATANDIETAELNAEKAKQQVDKSIIRG